MTRFTLFTLRKDIKRTFTMAYDTSAQNFFSVPSFVVSARLARDGEQVQVALASVRMRHFNTLVVLSSFIVFTWLTGAIPAGQGYYQPFIFILFFTVSIIGLHLAYCDWQTSRHFNVRRQTYLRRLEDYQRWRDLPRWDETRRFSRWHLYSQRMRQEERENRRQVTIHWIAQREEHIAPQAFYERERRLELSLRGFNLAMNRPADYVSITLQRRPHPITSWGLRATNSMNRIFPRNRPALVPRGNHPPQQGKTNKVVKLFIHCLFVLFNKVYFFS